MELIGLDVVSKDASAIASADPTVFDLSLRTCQCRPRSLARVLSWLMRTHNAWIRLGFDRCRRGLQALLFTGVWIHGALWGCFRCATSEVSRRFFGDQNASCQNLMACLRFIYPE